jgi:hypothetical protein
MMINLRTVLKPKILFLTTAGLLFLSATILIAEEKVPDWVDNFGKSVKYPEGRFLTGYGMSSIAGPVDKAQCMQMAADNARAELVKKIKVGVNSVLLSQESEDKTGYQAYVSNVTKTTANMEIEGLDVINFIDEKKKSCHCLALGDRAKLSSNYNEKVSVMQSDVKRIVAEAEKCQDKQTAVEKYLSTYPILARLDEARVIADIAGGRKTILESGEEAATRDKIKNAVDGLLKHPIKDIPDAAWFISYCLKEQKGTGSSGVIVTPFNYRDTQMTSQFSRFFRDSLMQKLVSVAGYSVIDKPAGQSTGAKFVLYGSYWDQGNAVKVIAVLKNAETSRAVSSVETSLPAGAISAASLEIKPQNFKQAFADMKVFAENEVQGGGLTLESWTDLGSENVVLTEGQKINLFVRVNQPSYIRFIYHLADGRRALLVDNYFIDESKVNSVYQIPEQFECAAPFGGEVMQVFSSTEKFPRLETREEDGYQILSEGLKAAMVKTRGLKKVSDKKLLVSEKRISITTMKK